MTFSTKHLFLICSGHLKLNLNLYFISTGKSSEKNILQILDTSDIKNTLQHKQNYSTLSKVFIQMDVTQVHVQCTDQSETEKCV